MTPPALEIADLIRTAGAAFVERNRQWIRWKHVKAHRSRAVWDFVRQQRGRLWLEFLPAYAPELNPTEYSWGHLKQHEIANLCPKNLSE